MPLAPEKDWRYRKNAVDESHQRGKIGDPQPSSYSRFLRKQEW